MSLELPIGPVLEHYGAMLPGGSGWQTILCPFHGETRPSFRVNLEVGAVICNGCPAKGDTIALIQWKENCDFEAALRFYEGITGGSVQRLREATGGGSAGVSHQRTRPFERNSSVLQTRLRRRPFGGT